MPRSRSSRRTDRRRRSPASPASPTFPSATSSRTTHDDHAARRPFHHARRLRGAGALGRRASSTGSRSRRRRRACPARNSPGTISGIDNRIDETTRTLRLEAELANEGRALKAGMAITVTLHFRHRARSSPSRASPCSGTATAPSCGRSWTARRGAPTSPSCGARAASSSSSGDVAGRRQGGRGRRAAAARGRQGQRGQRDAGDGRRRGGDGRARRTIPRSAAPARPRRRGAEPMTVHLEDARARLAEATKGISALCVRRPGAGHRLQPPDRACRARRLQRRGDPRAAGHRPSGHHHPRQL